MAQADDDALMGPKKPKSTVLTPAEEAIVVAFRQKTLLPLDDVLGCLRDAIPHLSRSALHRCLQRHGVSRLPIEETKEQRKRFKTYEIGYVHIDSCELHHADGKLVMFLAIDRVSKFTYVEFHDSAGKMEGSAFLSNAVQVFPYKIHTVLTDNGMAFADLPKNRDSPSRRFLGPHIFDRVLHEERHRAPVDQALSPLDQRPASFCAAWIMNLATTSRLASSHLGPRVHIAASNAIPLPTGLQTKKLPLPRSA